MSSETDYPHQRTVAELLAAHGDNGATGRRRRRRAADEPDEPGAAPREPGPRETGPHEQGSGSTAAGLPTDDRYPGPPPRADRAVLREPGPHESGLREDALPRAFVPGPTGSQQATPMARGGPEGAAFVSIPFAPASPHRGGGSAGLGTRPPLDPMHEHPTVQLPRLRADPPAGLDPGLTGPIERLRPAPRAPEPADGDDGGPPTAASSPLDIDDPDGLDVTDSDEAGNGADDEADDDGRAEKFAPRRRLGRAAAGSAGQAWVAVLTQWIVGAVGGAALWVGFRFLWRSLPVMALAAAVFVTVALVVVVRALLRNDDMRTTVFAVLVGLLLTVSPAILVLLGR